MADFAPEVKIAFIAFLGVLATGTFAMAVNMQQRYVSVVRRSIFARGGE
eukprot:CAMPEP_0113717626 /NCGR_PEP_ID=MMETSP0038_2-20120614/34670_1 /TAXON_ID=2898 /ORGANISM="Cryptomonas paramecium" /LENGTH=48 /DNA_ID=CAMNT_0000645521 /DNA_START=22 /DNA_END=165 /DNA_ORIENTATION=+ /assembly_acc=CAM_ASM_000170